MKRIFAIILSMLLVLGLAACGGTQELSPTSEMSSGNGSGEMVQMDSNILIVYDSSQEDVEKVAKVLEETLGGDLSDMNSSSGLQSDTYEFVLLGFAAQDNALPEAVQTFLRNDDLGARTIYPFVLGEGNEPDSIFSAISQLQPGALLGGSALMMTSDTGGPEIREWAENLNLGRDDITPENSSSNTVATGVVTPQEQQVLYLWEEGNAPAQTEYTINNGGYSDDPDFRPYITSFPVPELSLIHI